jgi:hypothetical protein
MEVTSYCNIFIMSELLAPSWTHKKCIVVDAQECEKNIQATEHLTTILPIWWHTPNSLKDSNVSPSERQRKREESERAP